MAELVGKQVHVTIGGITFPAVVVAYEPVVPPLADDNNRAVAQLKVGFPRSIEPRECGKEKFRGSFTTHGFTVPFDRFKPEPVTFGRVSMYKLTNHDNFFDSFTKKEFEEKWQGKLPPRNCFKDGDLENDRFSFYMFAYATEVPYMKREAVEMTVLGDKVSIKNISNAKVFYQRGIRYGQVIAENGKVYLQSNLDTIVEGVKVWEKSDDTKQKDWKHFCEQASGLIRTHSTKWNPVKIQCNVQFGEFIELRKDNFVFVGPEDRLLFGDPKLIPKEHQLDYTMQAKILSFDARPWAQYANVVTGREHWGPRLHNYLVMINGTKNDVPGGLSAFVKSVHTMIQSKGSWKAGPDGFSVDGFVIVPRAAITEIAAPSLKRKATD